MIFRYPGAKTKFLPLFREKWYADIGDEFTDVFVGGGSVLLDVAEKRPDVRLHANDLNECMHAFWSLVADEAKPLLPLLDLISRTPTVELFKSLRASQPTDQYDLAYRAVFFNRTTFSGIETAGPIGGEGQKSQWGIACRYNAKKLVQEICKARTLLGGRTTVTKLDATASLAPFPGFLYLDPPYYVKGDMLYRYSMDRAMHERLAALLRERQPPWALSYDSCPEIKALYEGFDIEEIDARYSINGTKTKWAKKPEVLVRATGGRAA